MIHSTSPALRKHLRKCSRRQQSPIAAIKDILSIWALGGALGFAAIMLPLYIKHPDAAIHFLKTLLTALTP